MSQFRRARLLADLRHRVHQIERAERSRALALPFDVPGLDRQLPGGGIALGALHEVTGAGLGAVHGAAAALFVAGVLARLEGPVLWCLRARDLFAPALAGAGLHPDRVVYVEAGDDKTVLLAMEEGLRQGGLAGVVGEASRLPMTESRRLQLAAETSGVGAWVIRRWRRIEKAVEFEAPTAAATRWRIASLPSTPLPIPGVGRARWRVDLVRCRGGEPATWELEACDAQGRLALPADLADRSAASDGERRAAAG